MIHNTRGKRWVFSYKKRLWRYGCTEGLMCGLFTTVPSWRDNFQSKPHTHTHMACLSIATRGTKKFPFWIYFWRISDSPVPRSLLPQPKESQGAGVPLQEGMDEEIVQVAPAFMKGSTHTFPSHRFLRPSPQGSATHLKRLFQPEGNWKSNCRPL